MQVLPQIFDERAHNLEIYAQRRLFQRLTILNDLSINQNDAGEFTNFIVDANPDEITGNPISTGEGVDFTEIDFGLPSKIKGSIIPSGFMFKTSDRLLRLGRLDSTLQVFTNKAIGRMVNFYDEQILNSFKNGAGLTSVSGLKAPQSATGPEIIENEFKIIDAMEFQNGEDTGFTPNRAYVSRADALAIKIALAGADLTDESQIEYVPTTKLNDKNIVFADIDAQPATIEKYANPRYSIISSLENESDTGRIYTEAGEIVPPSIINIKVSEPDEPERTSYYIWAELGLNILEPKAIGNITIA